MESAVDASSGARAVVLRDELRVSRVVALAQGLLMGSHDLDDAQAVRRLEELGATDATPERAAVRVLAWWSQQD